MFSKGQLWIYGLLIATILFIVGFLILPYGSRLELGGKDEVWDFCTSSGDKAYNDRQYIAARKFYLSALERAEKFGEYDIRLVTSLDNLERAYWVEGGKLDDVELLRKRALSIRSKQLPEYDPELAVRLIRLSQGLILQNKFDEAAQLVQRAISISRMAFFRDPSDSQKLIVNLNNLGVCFLDQHKYREAEQIYDEIIRFNPKYYLGFVNRSTARRNQNNLEGAEQDLLEARRLDPKKSTSF